MNYFIIKYLLMYNFTLAHISSLLLTSPSFSFFPSLSLPLLFSITPSSLSVFFHCTYVSSNGTARKSSSTLNSTAAQTSFTPSLSRSAPGSFILMPQSGTTYISGPVDKRYQNVLQCFEGSTYPEPAPPVSRLCIHGVLSQGTEYLFELPPAALNKYIGRRVSTLCSVLPVLTLTCTYYVIFCMPFNVINLVAHSMIIFTSSVLLDGSLFNVFHII